MDHTGFTPALETKKTAWGSGCTEAFVIGLTALTGNMNGQCVDSQPGMWPGFIRLVTPEKGNRYLMVGDDGFFGLLNEKGVALSGGFRPAREFPPYPGPGNPEYRTHAERLRIANSAAEFVKDWSEDYTRYGSPMGSNCTLVVDTKEGYCLEGANFVYGDPANHAIHGPMTDQVFVSGNFFISRRLKAHAEAGIGAGYNRAKRLWKLLIDRQYDCCVMHPSPPSHGGGITLPYFMKCLRDHGNVPPEEGRMSCYLAEERGDEALCCHGIFEYTTNAFFAVARADHTDLFSCEWITPNQPCMSPFLPVYIGINEVPGALGTTEAFDLFENLRAALDCHPEYREQITRHWTLFEIRTVEESYSLELQAARLADNGNVEGARKLLTGFVAQKTDTVMAVGRQMLEFLNGLPVLRFKIVSD